MYLLFSAFLLSEWLLPLVDEFAVFVLFAGELKQFVLNAARLEVADFDGGVEDAQLDAHADGVACLVVEQATGFLDALDTFLGLQRDVVALFGVLDAVGVVVGRELELGGVLVALLAMGVVDGDGAFLLLVAIVGDVVVPGNVLLVDELAFLALRPNGALGLVDADDVDFVVQARALGTVHHVVSLVENAACLLGVGCLIFLGLQTECCPQYTYYYI